MGILWFSFSEETAWPEQAQRGRAEAGEEDKSLPQAEVSPEEGSALENSVDLRGLYSSWDLGKIKEQAGTAEELTAKAYQIPEPVRILVLPHHRPGASLAAAALDWARKSWQEPPEQILLLGPNHENLGGDILALDCAWQTRAGILKPARELLADLVEAEAADWADSKFYAEHSMTMLLPLIAEAFPKTEVAPLIFRYRCSQEKLAELWQLLEPKLEEGRTLILLSADFSHGLDKAGAARMDQKTLGFLASEDWRSVAALDSTSLDCPALLAQLIKYAQEKEIGPLQVLAEADSASLLGSRQQESTSYLILAAGG